MDGPWHYREAEKIIEHVSTHSEVKPETRRDMIAAAQVHATLALAAAQVEDMESTELRPGWAAIVDPGPS